MAAKMLKINKEEGVSLFQNLSRDYKIIAPVEKTGEGRFSGSSLTTYGEVKSFGEIDFFNKTYFSPKEILFPIRETIFKFHGDRMAEVKEEILPSILFLRSCDIYAVSVMDLHFLKNGNFEDIYYLRRRQKLKIFLIECIEPFENCFCVSLGANRAENYSVFMRKTDDGYEVKIKDADFEKYFPYGVKAEVEPRFAERDPNPIEFPSEIDVSIFQDEMWKEYGLRCIACGRCNTSCPTCTCFTVQDIVADGSKTDGERRRIWSSCQVKGFGLLAGGHDFRIPCEDRVRYRVLHKIRDFKKKHGIQMCVGCGRCSDVCPEYISMLKCVEKINRIVESHA